MTENSSEQANPETGMTGQAVGNEETYGPGMAATVSAEGDLVMDKCLAGRVSSGGAMEITNSLGGAMVAGANLKVENGLAQAMVAGGNADLADTCSLVTVAGGNITASNSVLGVVVTDNIVLQDQSRILLDRPRAIVFGAAFGVAFAIMTWMLRRR